MGSFRTSVTILLGCLLLTVPSGAQQYSFRTYGVEQGLTNLGVKGLYQDKKGFLWVSTENGVFRYDGERFQSFGEKEGLPPSAGVAFGTAPDGSLLAGGEIGLYRRVGDRFTPIPMPAATSVSWFSGIQSDGEGSTYIATDVGLVVMTQAPGAANFAFRLVPKPAGVRNPKVYGLLVENHLVWYGCDLQLCQLKSGQVTVFGVESGLPASTWKMIKRAGTGDLWVQGRTVVARLRHGRSQFEIPDSPFQRTEPVGLLSADSGGNILVGIGDGLAIWAGDGWTKIRRSAGLRGSVYCALQDREGSLWIGLLGRGLVRWLGYGEWEAFTSDGGLDSDVVYQMAPLPDGSVWAGTEGGLYRGRRRNGVWSWQGQPQFGGIPIHSVRPDGAGRLWLGTESHGVARFDPATGRVAWFTARQGLNAKDPFTLLLDRENRVWAATEQGLFVADLSSLRFLPVEALPRIRYWAAVEAANGDIWIGSIKGLFRLSGGKWTQITTANGLSHDVVLSLAATRNGEIWVGYRHGGGIDRIRIHDEELDITRPEQYSGDRAATIYFLGLDARQQLWAGTDRGIDVWDGSLWNHYDRNDGLIWDDCDLNGFAAEPGGAVWIGTSGGLARFKPLTVASHVSAPDVVYTRLVLGKKQVDPAVRPLVDHTSNAFLVRYSTLTFARESSTLFRYRLAPLFEDWRETQQRELQFDGLPPGAYRFEVLARDGWGRWSTAPAIFSFQVRPPWWRTGWFVALIFLTPTTMVAMLWRFRAAAMRRRERELVQLVEDRTAELKRANEHLLRLSLVDGLTGVANRRMFDRTLDAEWGRMLRTGEPLSLVLLDIDYFKLLNDAMGHQEGDACLILLASKLRELSQRSTDLVARFGGEEFALILPATDEAGAAKCAEAVRRAVAGLGMRHPNSPLGTVVTVSLGVATATAGHFQIVSELVAAADQALYSAKDRGRDRVVCFDCQEDRGSASANHVSGLAALVLQADVAGDGEARLENDQGVVASKN